MNNIKQKLEINPDNSSFGAVELKANLNPEQREYLEILKAKMKKVLGNKTKQELAKAGDLVSLKNYKQILIEVLEFLQTKEMKYYSDWDNPDLKEKQLRLIDSAIDQIKSAPLLNQSEKDKLQALEAQRNIVLMSSEIKTRTLPESEVEITASEILIEAQVMAEIKELAPWRDGYFCLNSKVIDEQGNLVYLRLGIVGCPQTQYEYSLSGDFQRVSDNFETVINELDMNLKTFEANKVIPIGRYNELEKKWEIVYKKK